MNNTDRIESAKPAANRPSSRYSGEVLGQLGSLVVKIADTKEEISAALRLRHQVFFEQQRGMTQVRDGVDEDRFDEFCDHLVVIDRQGDDHHGEKIVATYRLMSQSQARLAGGFYTAGEFDVEDLVSRYSTLKFLELGRSCVLPEYRSKRTIELLWHGSWAYVRKHGFDVMFGCASLEGTDIQTHGNALKFLFENASADPDWDVRAFGERVDPDALPVEALEPKSAIRALPPLIKGYLRLGAMFAGEAVIDRQFGSIDVLVLLSVTRLNPRYVNYYGENAERHA